MKNDHQVHPEYPKNFKSSFNNQMMFVKCKVRIGTTDSVKPDQTAPYKEQSDLGLHCLIRPACHIGRVNTETLKVPPQICSEWDFQKLFL